MTLGYTFISSKSSYLLQKTRGGPTSSHLLAINEGKGGGEGGIKGDEECRPVKFTSPGAGEDGREGPESLPDRFKYSVNALMGLYDPPSGSSNAESDNAESFAISNALMKFPLDVEFVAVGEGEGFAWECGKAVGKVKGSEIEYEDVKSVGKYSKFKTMIEVENAGVLRELYQALDEVEGLKFKY